MIKNMRNRGARQAKLIGRKFPQPPEPLRNWQAIIGIPAMLGYTLGDSLAFLGLPYIPGPVLYLVAGAILVTIAPVAYRIMRCDLRRFLVGVAAAFAASFVFSIVFQNVLSNAHVPAESSNSTQLAELIRQSPLILVMVFTVGPIVEEILYRFVLFRFLYQRKPVVAHLLTALCFGYYHIAVALLAEQRLIELWYLPSYMAFSLIMSMLYLRTRTIFAPICAHALYNGLGIVSLLLT